jgi:hypothetical protein
MLNLRMCALASACVGFFGIARPAVAGSASDSASDPAYADGWQAGDNGGSGFEPWTFAFSGDPSALAHAAPQFIDTAPAFPAIRWALRRSRSQPRIVHISSIRAR